jgi:hypothetical protein
MKTIVINRDGKKTKIKSNSNWIEYHGGRRKESSGHMIGKRFYTQLDMAIIKKDQADRNRRIKNGETKRFGNEYISICGCGAEGCFIHSGHDNIPKEKMNEWEKRNAIERNKILRKDSTRIENRFQKDDKRRTRGTKKKI